MSSYTLIKQFYGERCAKRSRVPLINHIDEGLRILDKLSATQHAKDAFCLHPLLQSDSDIIYIKPELIQDIHPMVVLYAMEYRAVANAYLSHSYRDENDLIGLSALPQVNLMLVADKVQNRKDFDIYHKGTHPNTHRLENYFNNWLKRLGINEDYYSQLICL